MHTELIQHKRSWMIKRGIVKGKLSVKSAEARVNGSCPLMPEEVREYTLSNSGKENFSVNLMVNFSIKCISGVIDPSFSYLRFSSTNK